MSYGHAYVADENLIKYGIIRMNSYDIRRKFVISKIVPPGYASYARRKKEKAVNAGSGGLYMASV